MVTGRKVARLQHLFLGGRPSVRLTDGRSRAYNICAMLCFPPKIFLPLGIPNYIETIGGVQPHFCPSPNPDFDVSWEKMGKMCKNGGKSIWKEREKVSGKRGKKYSF